MCLCSISLLLLSQATNIKKIEILEYSKATTDQIIPNDLITFKRKTQPVKYTLFFLILQFLVQVEIDPLFGLNQMRKQGPKCEVCIPLSDMNRASSFNASDLGEEIQSSVRMTVPCYGIDLLTLSANYYMDMS